MTGRNYWDYWEKKDLRILSAISVSQKLCSAMPLNYVGTCRKEMLEAFTVLVVSVTWDGTSHVSVTCHGMELHMLVLCAME